MLQSARVLLLRRFIFSKTTLYKTNVNVLGWPNPDDKLIHNLWQDLKNAFHSKPLNS